MTSTWFKGKELVMAYGIASSLLRVGTFVNGPLMEHLASKYSVGFAFMIGFAFCIFSLLMGICLVLVDIYAEKKNLAKADDA